MYKSFFGLKHSPFDLTPDPTYFVSTRRHNEALAVLYYGIRSHKGLVAVTGEVGTGKTLLLSCLVQLLKQSQDISYAYVFNSRLSTIEFLHFVLCEFGLHASDTNKSEMLLELRRFLVSQGAKGLTTALIIDEAHQLPEDLLEEIRLLSNVERPDDKLVQIVLVGQPELNEKLDSPKLRQLKQRIALRAELRPLEFTEAKDYIMRRLQIAGADIRRIPIFSDEGIASVYRYSRGLPRLINTICENGLITAYARESLTVTPDVIEEVAKQFRLDIDIASSKDNDKFGANEEAEIRRVGSMMADLFANLLKSAASKVVDGDQA